MTDIERDLFTSIPFFECLLVLSKQCLGGRVNGAEHMGHWAAALSDLSTPHKYNVAISACKKAQQWQRALCLLLALEEVHFEADVIAFTSALSACQAAAQWQQALLLFELKRRSIVGNLITFTSLLSAFSCGIRWREAVELLCSLQEKELRQDVISCNAAISACGRSGRWLQALSLFQLAKRRTCRGNEITCNALLDAYGKRSAWQRASSGLFHMKTSRLRADVVAVNTVLSALDARLSHWPLAFAVLSDLGLQAVQADLSSFTSTIATAQWQPSLLCISKMLSESISGAAARNAAADGLPWERILLFFQDPIHDLITYNVCIERSTWLKASELLLEVCSQLRPTAITYGSCSVAMGDRWLLATQHLFDLIRNLQSNLQSNLITLNSLTAAYARAGRWHLALHSFEAVKHQMQADIVTSSLAKASKVGAFRSS